MSPSYLLKGLDNAVVDDHGVSVRSHVTEEAGSIKAHSNCGREFSRIVTQKLNLCLLFGT
jgi:hypothetical protein